MNNEDSMEDPVIEEPIVNKSDNEELSDVQEPEVKTLVDIMADSRASFVPKVDGRTISSKRNIAKARLAKAKKKADADRRLKELFDDSGSESFSGEGESDSDSEELMIPQKYNRKQQSKQQKEIDELKSMLFKMADKQKRDRRRRRRKDRPPQRDSHTPIINYTIAPPVQQVPIVPVKKSPKKSAFLTSMLKKKILDN